MTDTPNLVFPLCINCKYHSEKTINHGFIWGKSTVNYCNKVLNFSVVTGMPSNNGKCLCGNMRISEALCGIHGNWFEPKCQRTK